MLQNYVKEDLDYICFQSNVDFRELDGKVILVTGATGLIGFHLVSSLLYYGEKAQNPPRVIAVVRDRGKAERMYRRFANADLEIIESDITQRFPVAGRVDFIIHCASRTDSKGFVSHPVETIKTAITGTEYMLDLAHQKKVAGFLYLSSMEVYGCPDSDDKISEMSGAYLDTMAVRTSYPEGKRMCEVLCCAYYAQYGVPVRVIRLTQTFGPGVHYQDNRVFAEFARCVIENSDIVLHTKGETKRSYLYTADAVTAIFTILLKGENGNAYNAANEDTYCSIYEMAQLAAGLGKKKVDVRIQTDEDMQYGYAPALRMNLSTAKLKRLGWSSTKNLSEMYQALINSMMAERNLNEDWNNQS